MTEFVFRPHVAVIGGGPAGLACAEILSARGCAVSVVEQMPTMGRKLLMAGRGGLNLTHGEAAERFATRYGAARPMLSRALAAFTPQDMVAWAEGLGQPCFTGSSGRVFPRAMKASPLLRAWLARLAGRGVRLLTRHRWEGWDAAGRLRVTGPGGPACWRVNATVLAMGGASWARLGSDGAWRERLLGLGVDVAPFAPANCGFVTDWGTDFTTRFAGTPLRGISLALEGGPSVRGEAVVTQAGIEGGAVYALSAAIRDRIARDGHALVHVDLRPALDVADIATRLARVRARESLSNTLRKALRLAPEAIALLREGGDGPPPRDPTALARRVKAVPVVLRAPAALDRAISVAGGIAWSALDERLMLRARPGVFAAGEMLDWEAPTGGYLLQGCMATGRLAGEGAWEWLRDSLRGRYPSAP
ncbi:aminoacetone oxidase family FAD-binding enzyme [Komagataeibacter rhaeticus]|uniref:NAD(P)/FAD-dependent oxidoreductase n=1 Tax=Komagataeibacter rhaeticus TaxID=215221 RepID=UPI0004D9D1F6|nr:TIGR03862 family flavoprotein [Komagataeibacter rhaeticus]KDU95252.1 NAD(FAD)-utilizing dehydrogenase [Komagataeibacter rhaeticus AF1]MBL7240913.1 TIGR03862 family flavoprotein [Komagataeibacter rhaeticus]PYD53940.1 aminoacetone oxidase family FAD-binding enzyme [Komagataeibacter rhaeticus]GBQ17402.1 glutathione reductase [Komagataeibacter rhaeticus DSM 16663]